MMNLKLIRRIAPLFGIALALVACKGEKKAPKSASAPSAGRTNMASTQPSLNDSAVLPGEVMDQVPRTEADIAWREVAKAIQPPEYPEEWALQKPTKEQIAAFERSNSVLAANAADKLKDFYTRFPKDAKAAEAREQEYRLLSVAVQLGNTNRVKDLQAMEDARLKDPNASEDDRLELRMQQLRRSMSARQDDKPAAVMADLEKSARALQKEFPDRPEVSSLLLQAAEGWLSANEVEKSRALAKEVAAKEASPEVKEAADDLLKKIDRLGKPLALKFKAIDGREV